MNLKSKFFIWSAILLALVVLLGSVSVWNLTGLWRAAGAAAAEYDAMDRAEATSAQVTWLRDSLRGADARTYRDSRYFVPLQGQVLEIVRELRLAAGVEDGDGRAELAVGQTAADHLDAAVRQAAAEPVKIAPVKIEPAGTSLEAASELEQARQALLDVSKMVPGSARHHVTAAADRLLHRLAWTCVLLLVVLALSAGIHVTQYRALVRPLLWLRDDMRRSAARNYQDKVRQRGDREFKDVAAYFNGLARDLAELYRGMEEKIIARSRELIRSERLASVGFLAAGVAHEINNPLSVISGYAELATMNLRGILMGPSDRDATSPEAASPEAAGPEAESEAEALASALEAQGIIRDEAFRCKEITSRLLSLARGGTGDRQVVCVGEVARQVSVLVKGLKDYRDRKVVLDFEQTGALEVVANPTEMKQVLLNLTVNALEALPPERGEVRIGGRRTGQWVEMSVEDNGKGMAAETLEKVFEPFYTAKRGSGEPGTGLGLSITHAIIESHGGRIRAESRGPGGGSRFIFRLPARARAPAAAAHATVNLAG